MYDTDALNKSQAVPGWLMTAGSADSTAGSTTGSSAHAAGIQYPGTSRNHPASAIPITRFMLPPILWPQLAAHGVHRDTPIGVSVRSYLLAPVQQFPYCDCTSDIAFLSPFLYTIVRGGLHEISYSLTHWTEVDKYTWRLSFILRFQMCSLP